MATKQSTKKVSLPVTLEDVQFELEEERKSLSDLLAAVAADVTASLIAAFNAAGGCQRCRGRGWVVVWDTLDMMDGSCAEFGPCPVPECTEETRAKSGIQAGHNSKYDYRRGVKNPLETSAAYRCVAEPIVKQLDELRSAINEIQYQRRTFVKGDRVVVVRGRKVPIGSAGRVAWVSANTGGILVKDEDNWQVREAAGTWVDPRNLEKIA